MEFLIVITVLVPALSLDPKSVNIDLETSVLFEPKDARSNTSLLYNVRRFLDDLQQVLDPKPQLRAREDQPKFNEILEDLGRAVLNFSDDEITNLCKTLYGKVKKLKIRDDDGFIDRNLKTTAKNLLKTWTKKEPKEIRSCIKSYLENERGYFVDYIIVKLNNFFEGTDIEKIKNKLKKAIRASNFKDLNKTVVKLMNFLMDRQKNKIKDVSDKKPADEDIITAGRLDDLSNEEKQIVGMTIPESLKTKSDTKDSKEIILNKNIEVFVRAAD